MEREKNILVQKLDEFIRRYYKNQLLKGAIYATGILVSAFLAVATLEYFGHFGSLVRSVLFFGFLLATVGVLVNYIVIPTLKLNRIGQIISYEDAAKIIGSHFSNVQDKLLNVLQLQNSRSHYLSDDLLLAGINQKIAELRPVPFSSAINLGENKKHLRYVLPVVFAGVLIALVWPHVITKSTERLVNYQTYYEKEMPFSFQILNPDLKALQTQDYELKLKVSGQELPNEVFIKINNIEYKLNKLDNLHFSYIFSNLQQTTPFQFQAAGYTTREYTLTVLPKPSLLQFNLQLIYPAYLNKPNETIANTGDVQVPQGTKVNWVFNTRNTDQVKLAFDDSLALPVRNNENQFSYSRRLMQSLRYNIKTVNSFVSGAGDSVNYAINVLPDQFPSIDVSEKPDSLNLKNIYFSGQIKDDYGFSRLVFNYNATVTDSNGVAQTLRGTSPVSINRSNVAQPYFYFFDASQFRLMPGDKVEYYFEVFDNDGVNGPKSSKTQMMTFRAPTREEINEAAEKGNSEIKKDIEESINKARQLQKEINELSKKVNDKKQLGYEEKKKLEDLLKKQNELQNKINEAKQKNEQNTRQQNEFTQTDQSILDKQKQLEQLFENVMTPEMKKLFDELNKMMDKMDKNEVQEKLDELKLTNKDIEKELDRNLEAFKQLELEQKMQNAIDKLDELKQKEDALNKETEGQKPQDKNEQTNKTDNKKTDQAELAKKQEELSKEFDKLKKDLNEIEEKNKALEEPNKLPETSKLQEEISKEMENSSQQLSKNNKSGASKSQKSASEKMEEMREQMEQSMADQEQQQQEEDAQALRQILENLVNLSFSQEDLIKELSKTRVDNPKYVELPKRQNKLKDDSRLIEDSLFALSKRNPQISADVNRNISAIHQNMDKTVKSLAARDVGEASTRMQLTMKSVNDLALLLNESLEQMQNQMKQQMKSKGQKAGKCKNPGKGSGKNPSDGGTPSMNMRKLQEKLNQQLQQMKDALEKGQQPGNKPGSKEGQKPGQGGMGNKGQNGSGMMPGSEQFARMAAQQEALRRQMEELMSKLKNKGKNPGGDIAEMMEQTEKDLVNKQLTNETMRRQQEIMSRLLESEKAEREREQDEQRKSNEAKNQNVSNPGQFLEYKRLKEKEMELLNTVPPGLTPYYKERVNNYFNSIGK